jgi:hypothetical protein
MTFWTHVPLPTNLAEFPATLSAAELKDWFAYDWCALWTAVASDMPDPRPSIRLRSHEMFDLAVALIPDAPGAPPLAPAHGLTMLAAGTIIITTCALAPAGGFAARFVAKFATRRAEPNAVPSTTGFAGFVARRDEGVCHRIPIHRLKDPENDGKSCLIWAQSHYDRFREANRNTPKAEHADRALTAMAMFGCTLMDNPRTIALWRKSERWVALVQLSPNRVQPFIGVMVAFVIKSADSPVNTALLQEVADAGRALYRSDVMDTRIVNVHVSSPPTTEAITTGFAAVSLNEAMSDA